jgi:hypothetical protein
VGTVNPSLNTPFSGGVGGSEYFSGSSSYLSGPNTTALQMGTGDYTVEFWIYQTSVAGSQVMLEIGRPNTSSVPGFQIDTISGVINVYGGTTTGTLLITAGSTQVVNTWYHVALTRQSNSTKLFINGAQSGATVTDSTNYTSAFVWFGANAGGGSAYFNGFLSNARAVKGTAVYTANFTPPTAPLTAITNTSLLITGTGQGMFNNATFVDQGPNALTVTATGAPVYSGLSPFGNTYAGSVLFNGTSQYLSAPDNAAFTLGSGNFTVETWIYNGTTGARQVICGQIDSGGTIASLSFYLEKTAANKFLAGVASGGTSYTATSTANLPLNQWTHLAFVRNGNTGTLYINGTADGTVNLTGVTVNDSTNAFSIGRLGEFASLYFPGYISNLRITKGTAVYTANFTPSTTPLTAITNTSLLVRGDTGAFYDLSNNGVVINQTGSPAVTTQIKKFGNESGVFSAANFYTTAVNSSAFSFGAGDFTIEGWVYFTTLGTNNPVFDISTGGASPTHQIILDFRTGASTSKMFGYIDGVSAASTTTTVATGTWYYVALTRSGTTVRGFLNGTQELTFTSSANLSGSYFVGIGQYVAGVGNDAGYLDDIRITKGVARYTANFTPPTATFPTGS